MRKFEIISEDEFNNSFKDFSVKYEELTLPKRKTRFSAGYDFELPFDLILNPGEEKIIPTGIKVLLPEDEFLAIYIRSSLGFKYNIRMCNQVGIIDADYYNNIENEGHIFVKIKNEGNTIVSLKKKSTFVQGIFQKYYTVSDESQNYEKRIGGLGSTNKEIEENE